MFVNAQEFALKYVFNDNAGEDDCRVGRSKRRKEISKKLTDYLVQSCVGQSYLIEKYDDDSMFKEKFQYNIYTDNVWTGKTK